MDLTGIVLTCWKWGICADEDFYELFSLWDKYEQGMDIVDVYDMSQNVDQELKSSFVYTFIYFQSCRTEWVTRLRKESTSWNGKTSWYSRSVVTFLITESKLVFAVVVLLVFLGSGVLHVGRWCCVFSLFAVEGWHLFTCWGPAGEAESRDGFVDHYSNSIRIMGWIYSPMCLDGKSVRA
jgi:hypothetical protein